MMRGRLQRFAVRLLLVGLAALAALASAEAVVRFGLRYPPRGERRNFRIKDGLGTFSVLQVDAPRSGFWNVEAGNKVFHYNNVGLPGIDVQTGPGVEYVFLLGASWVEALQMPPEKTASAVLQSRLAHRDERLQVLNLGYSGADPYVAWLRSRFFATRYAPARIVLVLESFHTLWLERHPHPLDFLLPTHFGAALPRTGVRRVLAQARARSAFVNLLVNGAPSRQAGEVEGEPAATVPGSIADADSARMSTDLKQCLRQFQRDYGERFLLVSLLDHPNQARELTDFCRAEGIHLAAAPAILRPANRFDGTGHLNERGNRELGEFLDAALAGHASQP